MLYHFRKKFETLPIALLLGGFVFVFFFLNIGHDLFHNHEADHHDHNDCPVYHFLIALKSACILCIFLLLFFIVNIPKQFDLFSTFISQSDKSTHYIRGPPFLSLHS